MLSRRRQNLIVELSLSKAKVSIKLAKKFVIFADAF
jgi:hypothetical protein